MKSKLFCSQKLRFFLLLLTLCFSPPTYAEPFSITEAHAVFDQNKLSVDAQFNLSLNNAVEEALHAGIDIQLNAYLDLLRIRPYIFNEKIARWSFGYEIRYHSLTNRYLLKYIGLSQQGGKPNIDSYSSLSSLFNAIEDFHFQSEILGETLPASSRGYKLQLQISLNRNALPTPLRVLSYIRKDWRLKSQRHEWRVDSP